MADPFLRVQAAEAFELTDLVCHHRPARFGAPDSDAPTERSTDERTNIRQHDNTEETS